MSSPSALTRFAPVISGLCLLLCALTAQRVSAVASSDTFTRLDPGPINTADRAAVVNAFYDSWLVNERVPLTWTGDTKTCTPGTINPEAQQATLDQVNFFRRLSGLDPVAFDAAMSAQAQAAALIMDANNTLNHYPPRSWACWSEVGAKGAASSNLSGGTSGASAITSYMHDRGDNNLAAGHRKWIQTPGTRLMGSGSTDSRNALYVIADNPGAYDPAAPGPDWVSWPTPGFFPAPLEPSGRWSWFSTGRTIGASTTWIDTSQASVSMTGPTGSIAVSVNPGTQLVWQIPPKALPSPTVSQDVTATVTISGLTQTSYANTYPNTETNTPLPPISYTVTLIKPDRPLAVLRPPRLTPTMPMVGNMLMVSSDDSGSYANAADDEITINTTEWLREGVAIGRQRWLKLRPDDVGTQIMARLTVQDNSEFFAPTQVNTSPVTVFDRPSITGSAKVGQKLKVQRTWPPYVAAQVRWTRDGGVIKGARALSYRTQAIDRGRRLAVKFILRAAGYERVQSVTNSVRVR